jgi:integrase
MADIVPSSQKQEIIIPPHLAKDYEELQYVIEQIIKDVDTRSKRIYRRNGNIFGVWLLQNEIAPRTLIRDDMRDYHEYLEEHYSNVTAQNIWSVASAILTEYVQSGRIKNHPMKGVKGFEVNNESTHTVLQKHEAETLLRQIDRSTAIGKRDYAMLQVLLRTGLRRFECADLKLEHLIMDQGHQVLVVYGKGKRRDNVKVPVDVYRHIQSYLETCDIHLDITRPTDRNPEIDKLPLFFGFKRNGKPSYKPIGGHQIYKIVVAYAQKAGFDVTPHGLRGTLITYLLGEGEPLHKVQYYVRHQRPETTERYDRRKKNLDESPADKFFLQ